MLFSRSLRDVARPKKRVGTQWAAAGGSARGDETLGEGGNERERPLREREGEGG